MDMIANKQHVQKNLCVKECFYMFMIWLLDKNSQKLDKQWIICQAKSK